MHDPLARRLLVRIVLLSSVITLLTTALQIYLDYRTDLRRIDSYIALIERSYLSTLVNSLWNYDTQQTQLLLDGMLRLPDMELLTVISDDGERWQSGERASSRVLQNRFELVHRQQGEATRLGELTVVASVDNVLHRLQDRVVLILASNAFKTFVVAAFTLVLFHFMVTRHLQHIAAHATSLKPGSARPEPLALERRASTADDSLSQLETALNEMWRRLLREGERLRASEQRFRSLVEGSLQGVLIVRRGTVLYANQTAAEIFGYASPAGLLRLEEPFGFLAPEERARVSAYAQSRLAGGSAPHRYEMEGLRPDHSRVSLENLERVVDWYDEPAVLCTIIDVTARRRAEAELRRYHAELEALVEQRTAALKDAQEELVARARLSTIGQITATVSHELRNPLGTLRTSVHVLRRALDTPPEKVARTVDRIERNVERCIRITEELLDFARVQELTLVPLALDEWLADVLDEYPIPDAVTLRWRPGAAMHVLADRDRLEQCVLNVVDNACRSMLDHAGGGMLTISTHASETRVEIVVVDDGPGIAPDLRERVFEPLFSTRNFGVGLGLPLVRRTMTQHSGGVEIDDAPGAGARVILWLPRSEDDGRSP